MVADTLTRETLVISAAFGVGMVMVPPYDPPVASPEIAGLVSEVYHGLKISILGSLAVPVGVVPAVQTLPSYSKRAIP